LITVDKLFWLAFTMLHFIVSGGAGEKKGNVKGKTGEKMSVECENLQVKKGLSRCFASKTV